MKSKKLSVVATLMSLFVALAVVPAGHAAPGVGETAGGLIPTDILTTLNAVGDDEFALADLTLLLPDSNRTQHYGPYESGSPDSGTCGNNWAEDTYDRHFTVRDNGDGTFTVVQQFKRGSFVTNAGTSPGACDTSDGKQPGTIRAGVTGSMHGYFIITVTGTQTSTDPACIAGMPAAPCTTAGFISSHFAGPFTIGTYSFHYAAGDQGLIFHSWKNASSDRGGNQGDIASTTVP